MNKHEKEVDLNNLNKLKELATLCMELTIDQKNQINELNNNFSSFISEEVKYVGPTCNQNKLVRYKVDATKLQNSLKNESSRNKIKDCLTTGYLDLNGNMLIPMMFYKELSSYENVGNLNTIDDILSVLENSFLIQKSKIKPKKTKDAALGFITSISELLISKYNDTKRRVIPADYMYNNLSIILSSIKNNNYVIINNEEKFYKLLNLYYYINAIDGEKIDVASLMKSDIEKYNNIIREDKNKANQRAKKLYRYVSRNNIEKMSSDKFPDYNDEDFLDVINETRKYVDLDEKMNFNDKADVIAVLDCLKISYYKKK